MATRHDYSPKALVTARNKRPAKAAGKGAGLTPKVRAALEAMVFGIDGDITSAINQTIACKHAGISTRALRAALLKPAVMSHYRELTQLLREGERPANLRAAIEIRDSEILKASAAGQKVRLAAAAQLDADLIDNRAGVTVNVGVNFETPGYVIDLEAGRARRLERLEQFVKARGITLDHAYDEDELVALANEVSDGEIITAGQPGDGE